MVSRETMKEWFGRPENEPVEPNGSALLTYAGETLIKPLRPYGVGVAVWLTSVVTDDVPSYAIATLAGAAAIAIERYARKRLDHPDGERYARRRRLAARLTRAGWVWLTAAALVDWSDPGAYGAFMGVSLTLMTVAGSVPYQRWLAANRVPFVPAVELPEPDDDMPDEWELRRFEIERIWRERLSERTPKFKDSMLTLIREVPGADGWSAVIQLGEENDTDPDMIESAQARIAKAYKVGTTAVTLTLDPDDASKCLVMVLRNNPLWQKQPYNGEGIDTNGIAKIGRYASGKPLMYRFWDDGGCWHDLISGTTGSGKSELINLLLTMELRLRDALGRPLVAPFLIDPQHGQSYGELTRLLSGFVSKLEDARELIARFVAEMYRRNESLSTRTYEETRPSGRVVTRQGVKTWQPTAEEPMLSLTIDEAHRILRDKDCKEMVAELVAMGRKCGIRIRLVTQVPLLSSLGGKMEIRDAVASGNVVVFRTGNRLSGDVAANGQLPGKPHKLPKRWRATGETAAGTCYSVGEGAEPEMARTIYIDDMLNWLFDDDPELPLFRGAEVTLPPAIPTQKTGGGNTPNEDDAGAIAEVLAFLASNPGDEIATGDIAQGVTCSARSVTYALKTLTQKGLIEKTAHGRYRALEDSEMSS